MYDEAGCYEGCFDTLKEAARYCIEEPALLYLGVGVVINPLFFQGIIGTKASVGVTLASLGLYAIDTLRRK